MRNIYFVSVVALAAVAIGCSPALVNRTEVRTRPAVIIKPGEPIAIMPFETESVLSNLGSQLSDEIIVELFENAPQLKIVPGTIVKNYLANANLGIAGLPDVHSIHSIKEGVRCRYLLTGNLYTSIGDVRFTTSYSSRIAKGSLTLRLIDCDSMTVVWAKHLEGSYSTTLYYVDSQQSAIYRTDGELLINLIKEMATEAAKNFY